MKEAESRPFRHSKRIDVVVPTWSATSHEGFSERSGHGCRGAERQDDHQ
jgi:hypothetical protein